MAKYVLLLKFRGFHREQCNLEIIGQYFPKNRKKPLKILMQLAGFGTLHTATQDRPLQIMSHLTGHKIHTFLSARTVIVGEEPAWSLFSISSGIECRVKNSSPKYWNNYV
jgi:hypothetical protein